MTDPNISNFDKDQHLFNNRKIIVQLLEKIQWPSHLIDVIRYMDKLDRFSKMHLRIAIMAIIYTAKRKKRYKLISTLEKNNLVVNSSRPEENIEWKEDIKWRKKFLSDLANQKVVKG